LSRTHAQRLVNGQEADDAQAPSIDTLAFIAEAFGVTAAEFLTQGCKFAAGRPAAGQDVAALGKGVLQRAPSRRTSRRNRLT
jgi:transcriptional regulator with XRE-family HTH domain